MKNSMLVALILLAFMACQNKETPKQERREMEKEVYPIAIPMKVDTTHVHVFACPMHPEITGKEGDKCPKCGMALTHKD